MFSATFHILPGSKIDPSIATIINAPGGLATDTQVSNWNRYSYLPFISTITGFCRALLGVIHTIVHLVAAIFDGKNRDYHLEQVYLGARNVVRGCVEMLPFVVNNIALFVMDMILAVKQTKAAQDYAKNNPNEVYNRSILFVDGENVASKSFDELNQICIKEKMTSPPNFWKCVSMIKA